MFTFTPKHQSLVDSCYKSQPSDATKLSLLIHHIHLKPERLIKVIKYIKEKIKKEIQKKKTCKTSTAILKTLMNEFADKSVLFEEYCLKIVISSFKQIIKLKNEDLEDFSSILDILGFFSGGLKTFKGEKQIKKLLFALSKATETESLKKENMIIEESNHYLDSKNREESESSESSSVITFTFQKSQNLDSFFLGILNTILAIKDILNMDYKEKLKHILQILVLKVNEKRRKEMLQKLIYQINIINIRVFCWYLIVNASEKKIEVFEIISDLKKEFWVYVVIEINLLLCNYKDEIKNIIDEENEYLESESKNISKENSAASKGTDEKKKNIVQDIDVVINKDTANKNTVTNEEMQNDTLDKKINKLQIKDDDVVFPEYLHELLMKNQSLFLLFRWNYQIFNNCTFNQNIIELSQSFFYLLKYVFNEKQHYHDKSFVFEYLQFFLTKCPANDVLYIFVKKTFQYDIYIREKDKEKTHTPEFKKRILQECIKYSTNHTLVLDSKFLSLLLTIVDKGLFNELIFIYILSSFEQKIENDHEKAFLFKFRSMFYKTKDKMILEIIKCALKSTELSDKDKQDTINMVYNNEYNESICESDEKYYVDALSTTQRLYNHSLKSSLNLESLAEKRKTRLKYIHYFI